MLRCPKCKYIYNDETQKFCTVDGARLSGLDETVDEIQKSDSSRRTPTGELLFETFVSPPNSSPVKKVAPSKGKSSYQMFGLHSANAADPAHETKATNGFHSFDYLIVKENETTLRQTQPAPKFGETFRGNATDETESENKRKFSLPFILFCLLGALILLICLGLIVNHFFR